MSIKIPVKEIFEVREKDGRYLVANEIPVTKDAIFALATYVGVDSLNKMQMNGTVVNSDDIKNIVKYIIGNSRDEQFHIIFLDSKNKIIDSEVLFQGDNTGCTVYVRNIIRRALEVNCKSCLIGHNHPSMEVQPSKADDQLTFKLQESLNIIDVHLADHVIVNGLNEEYFSYAKAGRI